MAMKHTLLLMISAVVMAETPKPAPTLSTSDRIAIAHLMAESKKLGDAQAELKKQFDAIQSELCQQHYAGKPCQVTDNGTIVLKPEPPKPEAKK